MKLDEILKYHENRSIDEVEEDLKIELKDMGFEIFDKSNIADCTVDEISLYVDTRSRIKFYIRIDISDLIKDNNIKPDATRSFGEDEIDTYHENFYAGLKHYSPFRDLVRLAEEYGYIVEPFWVNVESSGININNVDVGFLLNATRQSLK